jgi:tetratricopeptide (TPR) repeat protein
MLYNRGDFVAALACYRAAAAIDETFPETNLNIGAAMLRMGRADSAAAYFEKEISLHPDRAKGYTNLAAVELVQGRFAYARTLARKSLSLRPYDPSAWVALLRASAQDSSLEIDSLREMALRASAGTMNSPWVCVEAGAALELRGDLDYAARIYLKGIRASDPPIETDDRLFEQGYEQSIAKDRRERARANMAYGSLLGRRGEYAQSAIYSSAAIEIDSSLSGAWINLVSALANLGQSTEAATFLSRALQRFPEDPVVQRMAGRIEP